MFFFLNTLRTLEAEHGITSEGSRANSLTHFRHGSAGELSPRPVAQDDCERPAARAPEKGGPGRLIGFKRSRLEFEQPDSREPDASDPDATADHSLNYEQELADLKPLPEQDPHPEEDEHPEEEHIPVNNNPADFFEIFFRIQAARAREAYLLNGN